MAFRFKAGRGTGHELRRLVRDELEEAVERLGDPTPDDDAIHDARTNVKKARAVLRLVRDELSRTYRVENDRLREAAHRLSSLRDADAAIETLEALQGHYPSVLTPAIGAQIARGLRSRTRRIKGHAARRLALARSALEQSSGSLPDRLERIGGFAAVRDGVVEGYRRASRAMRDLTPEAEAATFHLWRRRVKDHWYHVRLFERLHSGPRGRAARLEQLADRLGNDHDLTMLRATLLDRPERFGHARNVAIALGCIVKYQMLLREQALRLGNRLFKAKPSEIQRSVVTWWRALEG